MADRPEHRRYVEYAYEIFVARSPVVGGNDGGWADGLPYFGVNFSTVGDMAYMLQKLGRIDVFAKPWYRNMAEYFIYSAPAGGPMNGFGDSHDRQGTEGGGEYLLSFLAVEKNDAKALYQISRIRNGNAKVVNPWLQLVNGIAEFKTDPAFEPSRLPQARLFRDIGEAAMHTDVQNAKNDMALYFRSSPYGAIGHMHANQNCFNLTYKGHKVFYSSGYYTTFADPHTLTSYRHTQAHNGIVVNGLGQAFGHEGYGWIKRYSHGQKITYVCGDASMAYRPVVNEQWSGLIDEYFRTSGLRREEYFGDAKLKVFDRHIAMLRPNIIVVYDVLEAQEPVDWKLLLHSPHQLIKIAENQFSCQAAGFYADTVVTGSFPLQMDIADQFAVKPVDSLKKYSHDLPNQFHASFEPSAKVKRMRFLTLIQCCDAAERALPVKTEKPGEYLLANWTIRAALDENEEPVLAVTSEDAQLYVNQKPGTIFGKVVPPSSQTGTLLAERVSGDVKMSFSTDWVPVQQD